MSGYIWRPVTQSGKLSAIKGQLISAASVALGRGNHQYSLPCSIYTVDHKKEA